MVLYLHGLAAFRTQSATQTTHWASRGFVVLAADYPGLRLAGARIAVAGHSAGGRTTAGLGSRPGVQVLVAMASAGVETGTSLVSALIMGGNEDATVPYTRQQSGYESSPRPPIEPPG